MKRKNRMVLFPLAGLLAGAVEACVLWLLFPQLTAWQLLAAALVAGLVCLLLGLVLLLLLRGREPSLTTAMASLHETDVIDLAVELPEDAVAGQDWLLKRINSFTYKLNSIFLDIVAAIRKFNLFSADIYFSSRQLADLSDRQAAGMGLILQKAAGFSATLSALASEVQDLMQRTRHSAELYSELDSVTAEATGSLQPLVTTMGDARERALAGRGKMDISSQSADELSRLIAGLDAKLDNMNKRTEQIGQVLAGIQDIADRTHVLATNASIEAARVGKLGLGFRVIAGEVRTLAANSREAIVEVEAFLKSSSEDIRQSAQLSGACARKAEELKTLAGTSVEAFGGIEQGISEIVSGMDSFRNVFSRQHQVLDEVLRVSELVNSSMQRFDTEIQAQLDGYRGIHGQVQEAADGAAASAHSAKVLSQLGTYLKLGGQELNHIVDACKVSEVRLYRHLKRKEKRRTMLYNLEVFEGDALLGHLGDISL
ncbi:MAG: hypothetical protein KKC64_12955, partial [Spirochaetes bacterium]|nr:hypothetical protein [Spirochaetota bacterium]